MHEDYVISEIPQGTSRDAMREYNKKFQPFFEQACVEANPNNLPLIELDVSINDIIDRAKELMKEHESNQIQELKQGEADDDNA